MRESVTYRDATNLKIIKFKLWNSGTSWNGKCLKCVGTGHGKWSGNITLSCSCVCKYSYFQQKTMFPYISIEVWQSKICSIYLTKKKHSKFALGKFKVTISSLILSSVRLDVGLSVTLVVFSVYIVYLTLLSLIIMKNNCTKIA